MGEMRNAYKISVGKPLACVWFLSRARWIQFTPSNPISMRSILILSSHFWLDRPSCLFLRLVRQKYFLYPHACYMSYPPILLDLIAVFSIRQRFDNCMNSDLVLLRFAHVMPPVRINDEWSWLLYQMPAAFLLMLITCESAPSVGRLSEAEWQSYYERDHQVRP
jgi:hypothetical protein